MKSLWLSVRSLVFIVWLIGTLIPYSLAAIAVSVFLRGAPFYAFCRGWMWLAVQGARVICGVRWRVMGLAHLSATPTPIVLVSKHQSAWETLAYTVLLPRPLSFVFKRELLFIPFFGWAMARLDMIHIDRGKRTEAWHRIAMQGMRFLAQGHWVVMFPEGTRAPRGGQGTYKVGGARLAIEAHAVLVPIAVTSAKCWPRNRFIKTPGVIDVSIGPPLQTEGRTPADLMREAQTWIEAEMRRLDPQGYEAAQAPRPPKI
jgi:1-acyl-sn-glycerol-3-phosphate acyltransferase